MTKRLFLNSSDSKVWIYRSCWCLYVLSCTKIYIYRLPMGCLSYRAFCWFCTAGQSSCCSWVQLQTGIWAMPHLTGEGEALNRALQRLLIALGHSAGELSAVCSWWLGLQTARGGQIIVCGPVLFTTSEEARAPPEQQTQFLSYYYLAPHHHQVCISAAG